jgi:poly-gamma-glutamate system protein
MQEKARISNHRWLIVTLCAMALISGVESFKTIQKDPLFDSKVAAARLMGKAIEGIKKERTRMGIEMDPKSDPNATGIIGMEYTDLTTTLGSLSSKRTSSNPNVAGMIVEMLSLAGVKPGDGVALSFTGSFPALNIAALSAVHVLKLHPVIISSVGASMYGANDPRLTWLDMERILREMGIWPYLSKAASLGGVVETRGGVDGKGIEMGLEAIRRNAVPYIDEQGLSTLKDDIERRLAIYDRELGGRKPDVFINIGGTLTALGNSPETYVLSTGLLPKGPFSNHPERGIIFRMSERGVRVIHLLKIKKMAGQYGLPVDPIPLPEVPSGRVMRPQKHSLPLVLSGLIFLSLAVLILRSRCPFLPES